MGFPWLAIIYKNMKNTGKYRHYLRKTEFSMNRNKELPELYLGRTRTPNGNTPLGWSQALYLAAVANA
jgi:phosphorylase kinase alpha/beta subunit